MQISTLGASSDTNIHYFRRKKDPTEDISAGGHMLPHGQQDLGEPHSSLHRRVF